MTNAPTFLLPKKEATDSLAYSVTGFLLRKDLGPREKRLAQEILERVRQIKRG